jgi:hypothetical protein
MLEINKEGDVFTIKFTRDDISEDFLRRLLTKFKIEKLLEKSKMTKEQAWQLSEEIKENWWNQNKDWILQKIGINVSESNS